MIGLLEFLWNWTVELVKSRPELWLLPGWALVRSFGTTIETGSTGVLYVWGRAHKTLDPGFHFLIPVLHQVRSIRTRAVTLALPAQRVTTADGLVYDVDTTVVFHVADPIRCLTEVDDVVHGCQTVLPLALEEVMRRQTQKTLADRQTLDAAFTERARERLAHWGVVVEQAGLTSIAPTHETLRLTQMNLRGRERERVLQEYLARGLLPETAVALLGSSRQLLSHAAHRYRKRRRSSRRQRPASVPPPLPVVVAVEPAPAAEEEEDWF
jgi:regulator of protease activity HflC (stomatin/prohibitin superfamily)